MPIIANTWTGTLTPAQRSQLATFVSAVAPDCSAPLGLSFVRDRATNVVTYALNGERTIATLADLPLGHVELLDKT